MSVDFRSELLSVLFVGGYGTNSHLSLRRLFNPQCNLVALLHSPRSMLRIGPLNLIVRRRVRPSVSVCSAFVEGRAQQWTSLRLWWCSSGPTRGNRAKRGTISRFYDARYRLAWCRDHSRWSEAVCSHPRRNGGAHDRSTATRASRPSWCGSAAVGGDRIGLRSRRVWRMRSKRRMLSRSAIGLGHKEDTRSYTY